MVELGKPAVDAPKVKVPWHQNRALAFGVVGAVVLVILVGAAVSKEDGGSVPQQAPARTVSRADVTPWPFTAESGTLRCRTHSGVTFQPAGGSEYALNGSAEVIGYPRLAESAWALDPQLGNGLRVSVAGAIAAGSALC